MTDEPQATDGTDLKTIASELERGRVVRVEYETEGGETESFTGPVGKSNKGGIRVVGSRKLRVVSTLGLVFRTKLRGGSRRRRAGRNATVEVTDETRDVEYEDRSGWKVVA